MELFQHLVEGVLIWYLWEFQGNSLEYLVRDV